MLWDAKNNKKVKNIYVNKNPHAVHKSNSIIFPSYFSHLQIHLHLNALE